MAVSPREWARQGLKLSRQTMSNWVLRTAEDHLLLVHEELHQQRVKREVLHADEITLQVLHEPEEKAQTKSCMRLYRTSGDAEHPIVLYEYQPSWKTEYAAKFLEGSFGYLHTGGYQGYHKLLENIRVVGYWAHARRKFDKALNALSPDKREDTATLTELEYCNNLNLFAREKQFKTSPQKNVQNSVGKRKSQFYPHFWHGQIPFPPHPSPRWTKPCICPVFLLPEFAVFPRFQSRAYLIQGVKLY